MGRTQDIVVAAIISVLVSGLTSYAVTQVMPTANDNLAKRIDQLSTEIASIKSSLSTFEATLGGTSDKVTEISQKITEVENSISDINNQLSEFGETLSSLTSEVTSLRIEVEKEKAYQMFIGYMVESGSNLAVPITSHIIDDMDQNGLVPSIFGY